MTPTRVIRAGLALALAAGALAACAQIPDSGPVSQVGGQIDDDQEQVEFAPPAPTPGATPTEIVTGFIEAMQAIPPTTEFAAQFLTKEAATGWDPSRVVIYQGSNPRANGSAVDVTVMREATLNSRGAYSAVLPSDRSDTYRYLLRQEDGEWRITNPLNAFYIDVDTFGRSYLPYSLYFIAPSGEALVPYPIYLPDGEQLATSLVNGVLAGPPVREGQPPQTAVPPETSVNVSVSISPEGIAEIRLTGPLLGLTDEQARLLSAQLVWTVSQVSGVTGVRILVEGALWNIPGVPPVQDVGELVTLDPAAMPARDQLFALSDGRLVEVNDTVDPDSNLFRSVRADPVSPSMWGSRAWGIRSFDIDLNLHQLLAVTTSGDQLMIGKVYSSKEKTPTPVDYVGTDLSQPVAMPPPSREWLVVDRQPGGSRLLAVSDGGAVRQLPFGPLRRDWVRSLSLSPDGTRFAAVAQRIGVGGLSAPRLVLGQVRFRENGTTAAGVDGVHEFVTTGDFLGNVRSVAWVDATTLGVLGSVDGSVVAPYTVRIDGSQLALEWILPTELGAPVALLPSVSEGGVYVQNARGQLWFDADGEWKPVGSKPLLSPTFPG